MAHDSARAALAPGSAGSPAWSTRLQWVVGKGTFDAVFECELDMASLARIALDLAI